MLFTKRLRAGVKSGEITCSVRIWKRAKVSVGKRYTFYGDQGPDGEIEIDSIEQIAIQDITHTLAVASGFLGVIDLLKVAKHGAGDNVFLVRFHYVPASKARGKANADDASRRKAVGKKKASAAKNPRGPKP